MPEPGVYPRGGPRPTSSRAEQDLHRELAKQLPAGWLAWHSLRVRTRDGYEGEGDFVLAVPGRGILLLEVKGGAIEVRDGIWLQNARPLPKAPREQAHAFRRTLASKLEEGGSARPRIEIVIAFPETPFSLPPTQGDLTGAVIGQQDLPFLREALTEVAERLLAGRSAPGRWIEALHALWCETWKPALSLGDRTRLRAAELIALDAEQLRLLDCIDDNPRLLVLGGAGTGKTLVARELYHRFARRGRRPLYLCSTSALAAGLRADGLDDAFTVREIAVDLLKRAGIQAPEPGPTARWSAESWELVPLQAATDALGLVSLPYDALLVDEAQDMSSNDWDLVQALAGTGPLWIFADEAQSFWSERRVPAALTGASFRLMQAYRCPEPLARFADLYGPGAALGEPTPFDELNVVRIPAASALEDKVAAQLNRLLGGGARPADIAVLSLGGQTRTRLGIAERIGRHAVARADAPDAHDRVVADTFLRFKGLERPWIVIAELSAGTTRYDVRMHVALTRATVGCVVVATDEEIRADSRLRELGAAPVRTVPAE